MGVSMDKSSFVPKNKQEVMKIVKSLMVFVIMFVIGSLPPVGPITPMGMKILGIFVGLIYGWSAVDMIWPSLIGLVAISATGFMTFPQVLQASFGSTNFAMALFMITFSYTLTHYGVSKILGLWVLSKKILNGRPKLFTLFFLYASAVLGIFISATPGTLIGWSILYGLCDTCGYKKGEGYTTMMVFGCMFAAQLGMSILPFKGVTFTGLSAFERMSGITVDYAAYMAVAIVTVLIMMAVYLVVGTIIFKPDYSKLMQYDNSAISKDGALKMNAVQRVYLVAFICVIFSLLAPNILPAEWLFTQLCTKLTSAGLCILVVGICCMIQVNGEPLLKFKAMLDRGGQWGIIFLLSIVQPLSTALSSDETGILNGMTALLDPVFAGRAPLFFICAICLATIIITNFANNGATAVAMLPFGYAYALELGINPNIVIIIIVMSAHIAYMVPSASGSAALLHGNTEWISSKTIIKVAPVFMILSFVVIVVVSLLVGNLMY